MPKTEKSKKQSALDDGAVFRRAITIDPASVNGDERSVELTFSSEIEYERWPGTIEVLSHSTESVDLSRLRTGAPLLFNHDHDAYIGVIESASIGADRKGRAVVRFSESDDAEKIWRDVQAGILRNVSVGYRIKEVKLTEERDNGTDVYTVNRWEPYEISIVTIPADISVGIGRSLFEKTTNKNIMNRTQITAMLRQLNVSFAETATDEELSSLLQRSLPAPAEPAPSRVHASESPAEAVNAEQARVRSIIAAGKQYGVTELAQDALEKGQTVDQFRAALVDHLDSRNKAVVDGTKPIGMSEKEARSFSFIKLFRALSCEPDQRRKLMDEAAFEIEACRAAADQMVHRSARGTVIPTDVLLQPLVGQRNVITGAQTASGYVNAGTNSIQTSLLSSSFIDLLRNRSFLMSVVSELSGLVGNIDIPRQLTGPAAEWVGEDIAANPTGVTFGLVSLRPKTLAARSEITRKLLMQSSLGVEALLRADLARVMALEMDRAGLYGTGASNQPLGLAGTSGINTGTWATANSPIFSEIVNMETQISLDNADVPSMAYAFNAGIRGRFKTTRKFADGNDGTIWEPGDTVNGYGTQVSNVVGASDVFFGNWSDFLLGMWGGLDVTVDPYTHSDKGRIRITNFQDVDYAVRRPESFALFRNA
jgi:HK97 family phage major capsid protein/HK97 family phage prohead protease